jgi:hypothetical protein
MSQYLAQIHLTPVSKLPAHAELRNLISGFEKFGFAVIGTYRVAEVENYYIVGLHDALKTVACAIQWHEPSGTVATDVFCEVEHGVSFTSTNNLASTKLSFPPNQSNHYVDTRQPSLLIRDLLGRRGKEKCIVIDRANFHTVIETMYKQQKAWEMAQQAMTGTLRKVPSTNEIQAVHQSMGAVIDTVLHKAGVQGDRPVDRERVQQLLDELKLGMEQKGVGAAKGLGADYEKHMENVIVRAFDVSGMSSEDALIESGFYDKALAAVDPAIVIGKIKPHARSAWKIKMQPGEAGLLASKVGGAAWNPDGGADPVCERCERPMSLFLQLNLKELPNDAQRVMGGGLLQFFACTSDEECLANDGWEPYPDQRMKLVRVVTPPAHVPAAPAKRQKGAIAPQVVTLGQAIADHPELGECTMLPGVSLTDKERDAYHVIRLGKSPLNDSGNKLLGWPSWAQAPEYPSCPQCGQAMSFRFQISDCGQEYSQWELAHFFQCDRHQEEWAVSWQH